jgi:hypothetical protein
MPVGVLLLLLAVEDWGADWAWGFMDEGAGFPSNEDGDGAVMLFDEGPVPGVAGALLP